jgi:iron complex outermembrane receptor protein
MDDISLGYTFPKFGLWTRDISMRVAGGVQNVFVITKYKGLDPETSVASGIDSNIYPRPRVFSLRLGINF